MYTVYILYSKKIKNHYTGFTSQSIEEKLSYHNYNNKGFTGNSDDWKVIYTQVHMSNHEAMKIEKQIKKRGAKRYLEDQKK